MIWLSIGAVIILTACVAIQAPSIKMKRLGQNSAGFLTLAFSTDQLAQAEAQEVLLLASAIVTQRSGRQKFQFRTVNAEGLVDGYSESVRYFDIDAVVQPLDEDFEGDRLRKTYDVERVIGFFGPKYMPVLSESLSKMPVPGA